MDSSVVECAYTYLAADLDSRVCWSHHGDSCYSPFLRGLASSSTSMLFVLTMALNTVHSLSTELSLSKLFFSLSCDECCL